MARKSTRKAVTKPETSAPSAGLRTETGTLRVKVGLAEMLKGGVIMDVTNADQAKIAEDAGAVAVMALERVPADIRKEGGVARMADPLKIMEIMDVCTIPVMAKCRIGHFAEAQILEAMGVDYVDESEVLTPADESFHVDKFQFKVPFVCGARDLGEALRGPGHRGTVGAKVAVAHYFGQKFQKSKKVGTSNWASPRLNERQLLYAANDAHVALQIYHAWLRDPKRKMPAPNAQETTDG